MGVTVYEAPAGSGKSWLFAKRIATTRRKGRIEVYVPTHALADELKGKILVFNPARRVKIVLGRDQPGPHASSMCIRHVTAAKIIAAGQSVYPRLCHSGGPTATASVCQHYDTCAYIGQFTGADVYIFTHAYLPLDRGMLDRDMPAIVVIDESFFQTCLETIRLNIQLLVNPNIPFDAQPLCTDIAGAIRAGTNMHSRFVTARARGGDLKKALASLRAASTKPSPHLDDKIVASILATCNNFEPVIRLIKHLDKALTAKTTLQSLDFDVASGNMTLPPKNVLHS